jgi:hypothetical protein
VTTPAGGGYTGVMRSSTECRKPTPWLNVCGRGCGREHSPGAHADERPPAELSAISAQGKQVARVPRHVLACGGAESVRVVVARWRAPRSVVGFVAARLSSVSTFVLAGLSVSDGPRRAIEVHPSTQQALTWSLLGSIVAALLVIVLRAFAGVRPVNDATRPPADC